MIWLRRVAIGTAAAFVATAGVAIGALIIAMFSTPGSEPGRRTTLFGALFFEVRNGSGGAIEMGFGIESFVPIVLIFLTVLASVVLFQVAFTLLRQYREQLVAEGIGQ